jgi:hypothetical protein
MTGLRKIKNKLHKTSIEPQTKFKSNRLIFISTGTFSANAKKLIK